MDDGDDRGSPFEHFFSRIFSSCDKDSDFPDIGREMENMQKMMDSLFRGFDGAQFSIGFHPPPMSGDREPPHRQSPRDMMLKNEQNCECGESTGSITPQRTDNSNPPSVEDITQHRTSIFGPSDGNSSWNFYWNMKGPFTQESWSSSTARSKHVVQLPDGSRETVEKVTKDGRTCTTVTRTDPNGVTTTNTTCDLPAIENKPDLPRTGGTPEVWRPETDTRPTAPPRIDPEPGMTSEDSSFFNRLFGANIFKPKK